jgi:hypothetical protein
MSLEENQTVPGKPWTVIRTCKTFDEADTVRKSLLDEWDTNKVEGMQVKIKLKASGFTVRTRLHPDFEPVKKTKKTKKGKKNG